jgi:hypothetical protein
VGLPLPRRCMKTLNGRKMIRVISQINGSTTALSPASLHEKMNR